MSLAYPHSTWRGANGLYVARKLGLAGGLKAMLDAGDAASYGGSGQTWGDLSGNACDFYRGADVTATTDDPTFNGTAGRLSNGEYWGLDGADDFTRAAANDTWINNLHKDSALFTLLWWIYPGDNNSTQDIFGTWGGTDGNIGIGIEFRASAAFRFQVAKGSLGVSALVTTSTTGLFAASAWQMFGLTVNEVAGTGFISVNGRSVYSFTSTYSTPTASDASHPARICGAGNGQRRVANGTRVGMFGGWEGVPLVESNHAAFFNATRGRFGV